MNMRKIIILFFIVGFAYSINGTIVFYDGTTLDGEITAADTNSVLIIPNGLVLPEEIPVPDIESLILENGITMVDNGVAKNSYQDGKFAAVKERRPEPEFEEEEEFEYFEFTNLDYFSFNGFGGLPIYYRSSLFVDSDGNQDSEGNIPEAMPNLGGGFSLPYFPIGPINVSLGGRLFTMGFNTNYGSTENPEKIKAITLAGIMNVDLQPIFTFLGEELHVGVEGGLTYAIGWQEDYAGGIGVIAGGNLDYWFTNLPIAIRFFGHGYMIRQPNDSYTGFGNIGAALIVVLKRGE
ncbi:uncharacterized protein METZ01_LOCUS203349 [marine metagenome]|uniref:Uncharacterized protein n=1 Tax=marine metagenome TaxID=408172 RepID=A0A382EJ51_9ZZZZ